MRHVYNEELAECESIAAGTAVHSAAASSAHTDLLRCLTQCPQPPQRFSLATLLPSRLVPRDTYLHPAINHTKPTIHSFIPRPALLYILIYLLADWYSAYIAALCYSKLTHQCWDPELYAL